MSKDGDLIHTDELRVMQPQAKLPVVMIDGEPLYESAAICTHLCDPRAGEGPGRRAGHVGARLAHAMDLFRPEPKSKPGCWSSFKHLSMYPEEQRVPAVLPVNEQEIRSGLAVVNDAPCG